MNAPLSPDQMAAHTIDQLGHIKEVVTDLHASALTQEAVRHAMADGLFDAINRPEFWPTLSSGLQRHARDEAGGWLLGSLKTALSRVLLFTVIGLLVYLVGGWTALVSFFKSGTHP